ncbi:VOC family protein [Cryptosporangium phraense]|uniref:VOC family protein n=1 Tax=Cryptosporangium phraense TaxID=2593070 RepID=A0A545AM31_9ACTN|nr:VOC family protein [Cryptosporangium phraense]TQS42387.1 VOC family protein [Cryptosporangium phraense]
MTLPRFRHTVLDCVNTRELAEFYRQLLGFEYRPGHEAPPAGQPDPNEDWLVLRNPTGPGLAFQRVESLPEVTWPEGPIPQQLHLDLTVPDHATLAEVHKRTMALGATLLDDTRSDDPDEAIYVYADPAGHPFCIFLAAG